MTHWSVCLLSLCLVSCYNSHFPFRLQYPKKATEVLEADFHQKLIMKFNIKDSQSGQLVSAHQTFVKLTNLETKQEIIFIAEADSSLTNKFDLVT